MNWDDTLKSAVGYVDADDGTFFIDEATYHDQFDQTQIHFDTTDLAQTYFLVLDDDTTRTPVITSTCLGRNNCLSALHKFTVTVTEAQTIYMSAHTWPLRTYPQDCIKDTSD